MKVGTVAGVQRAYLFGSTLCPCADSRRLVDSSPAYALAEMPLSNTGHARRRSGAAPKKKTKKQEEEAAAAAAQLAAEASTFFDTGNMLERRREWKRSTLLVLTECARATASKFLAREHFDAVHANLGEVKKGRASAFRGFSEAYEVAGQVWATHWPGEFFAAFMPSAIRVSFPLRIFLSTEFAKKVTDWPDWCKNHQAALVAKSTAHMCWQLALSIKLMQEAKDSLQAVGGVAIHLEGGGKEHERRAKPGARAVCFRAPVWMRWMTVIQALGQYCARCAFWLGRVFVGLGTGVKFGAGHVLEHDFRADMSAGVAV
eukprot:g17743.t1